MLNHFCLVAFRYLHFLIENTLGSSLYHSEQYTWVIPFAFRWLIFSLKWTGRRYILIGSFFWTLWDNEFIPVWRVPWVILLLFSFVIIKNIDGGGGIEPPSIWYAPDALPIKLTPNSIKNTWVYYTQVLNFCKRIFFLFWSIAKNI